LQRDNQDENGARIAGAAGLEWAFMVTLADGRLPVRGEVILGPGPFEIEVLDADPRRVKRLRIGLRKERPPVRPRDGRRRENASDITSQPQGDPASLSPPGDGGEPQ